MSNESKIGIVADNYKLPMFKKHLNKTGFTYKITPLIKNTSTITVMVPPGKIKEVETICKQVEVDATRGN